MYFNYCNFSIDYKNNITIAAFGGAAGSALKEILTK